MYAITRPTIRSRPRRERASMRGWIVLAACLAAGILASTAAPALASSYTATGLGSLGFGTTIATGINASGQITGESYLATEVQIPCSDRRHKGPCFTHPGHALLWSNGAMTDVGTLRQRGAAQ